MKQKAQLLLCRIGLSDYMKTVHVELYLSENESTRHSVTPELSMTAVAIGCWLRGTLVFGEKDNLFGTL